MHLRLVVLSGVFCGLAACGGLDPSGKSPNRTGRVSQADEDHWPAVFEIMGCTDASTGCDPRKSCVGCHIGSSPTRPWSFTGIEVHNAQETLCLLRGERADLLQGGLNSDFWRHLHPFTEGGFGDMPLNGTLCTPDDFGPCVWEHGSDEMPGDLEKLDAWLADEPLPPPDYCNP